MFDLYQYLPRLAAARLARNGSQTSFIPDVFARAAKQIRRIPRGGRAASPTDRLTLRATNYVPFPASSLLPLSLSLSLSLSRNAFALPATLVYSQVVLPRARILAPARSIGRHNKKSKRQEILYARSTGELHSSGCSAVFRISSFPRDLPKYLKELQWKGYDSINVQDGKFFIDGFIIYWLVHNFVLKLDGTSKLCKRFLSDRNKSLFINT